MFHSSESIKTKFVLSISGTVVFFLLVLLFVSYSLLRDTALRNAEELSDTILTETDKQIDTFFQEIEYLSRQIAGYPAFYEVREDEMRILILSTVRARNEYLRAIYLGTVEGRMLEWGIGKGFVNNAPVFEPDYDPRRRPWYREAVEAGDFTITKPYVYASVEALGITGVLPLRHPDGSFVGVLGLDIMLDDLRNMIEELEVQKGGRVILLNQENQVIVSQFDEQGDQKGARIGGSEDDLNDGTEDDLELKDFDFFDVEEVESKEGRHFFKGGDGVTSYYIAHTRNEKTGWKLFIALPYEEVMAQATENIKFVIFIDVLLMLLLSVVIGFLSNIIILHPLENTVNVMRRLEHGESDARVPVKTRDEIGTLARQFNRLIETVNDYHQRLEEKVRRRTEELASLQQENIRLRIIEEKERIYGYLHDSLGARLTNIFISNNVAQSAVTSDPKLLRKMLKQIEHNTQQAIEDLKEILFSSRDESRKMINFPRVLKHNITERLNLKGISLSFLCKNSEDFNELNRETRFEIEKILQELVSNVLKHSEASHVGLTLDLMDETVHIDFTDDGVGIPPDRVESSGFGLRNMKNRIGHLGGKLWITCPEGGGTAVSIRLPVLVTESADPYDRSDPFDAHDTSGKAEE